MQMIFKLQIVQYFYFTLYTFVFDMSLSMRSTYLIEDNMIKFFYGIYPICGSF